VFPWVWGGVVNRRLYFVKWLLQPQNARPMGRFLCRGRVRLRTQSHAIDAKLLASADFDLAQYRHRILRFKNSSAAPVLAAPGVTSYREGKMTEFIEVLRQEHRNIESLLRVLERELAAGF
jgi:hypothetical protein